MQCPFCREFAVNQLPGVVDRYVRPGRVRMEFQTLAFLGPDSVKAAKLVEAARRQNRMWNVVDDFFVAQGRENSGWVTDSLVNRIGASVPGFRLSRAKSEAGSSAVAAQLQAAQRLAGRYNIDSTPSFLVGRGDSLRVVGADQVEAAIKQALKS